METSIRQPFFQVFFFVLMAILCPKTDPAMALTDPSAGTVERKADYGSMSLFFISNQGQFDRQVAYAVQGKDKSIYFTARGLTFVLTEKIDTPSSPEPRRLREITPKKSRPQASHKRWVVQLDFVGARPDALPESLEQAETVISYFKGKPQDWQTGLRTSSKIIYRNLWPGIDLVYYGTVNRLKYEFIVHPGADPAQIRLAYRGADKVQVTKEGRLEVTTPQEVLQDEIPVAWQENDGKKTGVSVAYALDATTGIQLAALSTGKSDAGNIPPVQPHYEGQVYGFTVGDFDRTKTLVLDPEMLVYCGFIGGSGTDSGGGIAVDDAGNAYVTGATSNSTEATFPVEVGPDLTYNGGDYDAFVAKVNAAGTSLIYCGYIGGSDYDISVDIAVDGAGNAYVTGYTRSTEATFPVKVGPDLTHSGGIYDAFVAEVDAAGTSLIYCGYIGGSGIDSGSGIAVDDAGNAFFRGSTDSTEATFPVKVGPDLTYNGGSYDTFVAKVNAAGTALIYCGYIGGSGTDLGGGIAVDYAGNAFVSGATDSTEATFPVTVGPDLTYNGGIYDAFVAKVNAAGTSLVYCGYIGGSDDDRGGSIAVDGAGIAYFTGSTGSTEATFPVTVGPDLTYNGGVYDAFVAKVNAAGTSLVYCGYIGGSDDDRGGSIAVDGAGIAYFTGSTGSTEATFPVKVGPDLTYNGGIFDAFVAEVNADGTALIYCGYIGGLGYDFGGGIALDGAGNTYVTGMTMSTEATFPVTTGPDLTSNGLSDDAFVAKIAPAPDAPVAGFTASPTSGLSPLSVSFSDQSTGEITSWAWDFDNNGSVDSTVQNPTHMYFAPGIYSITLTVNGPGGSDSATRASYIVITAATTDADNDGLPDNWEVVFFGNTTEATKYTDWDKDGYTDLQEYLNQLNSETDPAGKEYDPETVNAPGGTGYVDREGEFWVLMIPAITAGSRCAAIPNGNFESGNTAWIEYSKLGYEIITNDFPAGLLPHSGSYAAWLGGDDNEISLIQQQVPISSSCPFLTFYHWIDSADDCGYDFGFVFINDTLVRTYQLCAARDTGGWRVQSIDLRAYAGKTVKLVLSAATDEFNSSSWLIDDVSFQTSAQ